MAYVLDTPEAIAAFRELQAYYALKLEVNTGLRHSRGSVMNLLRERYNIPYRTKAKVLAEVERILKEKGVLRSQGN
jgi:hypothetical protein